MFPWARVQNGVLPRPNATLQATHAQKIPFIMFTYFYVLAFLFCLFGGIFHNYSRTQETRTLKGNDKQFELWGFELSGSITNSIFQVEN